MENYENKEIINQCSNLQHYETNDYIFTFYLNYKLLRGKTIRYFYNSMKHIS